MNEKIIDLLYEHVISEGGDGDAIWYSRFAPIRDIIPLLESHGNSKFNGWTIERKDDHILWGIDQEWVIITDNRTFYDSQPEWITLKIIF